MLQRVDLVRPRRARRRRRRSRSRALRPTRSSAARWRRSPQRRRRAALARADREADPGRRGARRRQLRRGDRAAARERRRSRAAAAASGSHALARALGADVPFFLQPARSSATATARRSTPLDLPQDYWVVLVLPHGERQGVDRPPSTPRFDGATAQASTSAARRAARRARARPQPRDLAALPPNDLASSPLAAELRAAGAFRADVSGAGPAVYGLFRTAPRRRPRRRRFAALGPRLDDATRVVRLTRWQLARAHRAPDAAPVAGSEAPAPSRALDRGRRGLPRPRSARSRAGSPLVLAVGADRALLRRRPQATSPARAPGELDLRALAGRSSCSSRSCSSSRRSRSSSRRRRDRSAGAASCSTGLRARSPLTRLYSLAPWGVAKW